MSLTNTLFKLARASATGRAASRGPGASGQFDVLGSLQQEHAGGGATIRMECQASTRAAMRSNRSGSSPA
jgi:hypothetical protein